MSLKVLFHVKHGEDVQELLDRARELGVELTAEQAALLVRFESLLRERAVPGGSVSEGDLPRIRERHVLDCLRAAAVVSRGDTDAYDLGSGAGLPGIVVAIARPGLAIGLVEARRLRAAFLELAAEVLELGNVRVLSARIEDLDTPVDLCFARALAPLPEAWRLAAPLLRPGGRLVHFAGEAQEVPPEGVDGRTPEVRRSTVLESAGPLVIMAR